MSGFSAMRLRASFVDAEEQDCSCAKSNLTLKKYAYGIKYELFCQL
jgi:hypothetical protein